MKISLAWPPAGWLSSAATNATFVPPMSERERRNCFGMAKQRGNRLAPQVTVSRIFASWFHDKIRNFISLLLGREAIVSRAQFMRYAVTKAGGTQ